MVLHRRVALGGVQLDSVDSRILIQGVEPSGKDQVTTVPVAGGGSRVTGRRRDWLDVTVRFTVNAKSYDGAGRAAVLEKVMGWARPGGWLTMGYKSDRRVRVFLAQPPAEADVFGRREYAMVFRACGVPYFQEVTGTSVSATGATSMAESLTVNGTTDTALTVQYDNTSGETCSWVQVKVGNTVMLRLEGMSLLSGERLVAETYDNGERAYSRIQIRNAAGTSWRSALAYRTAASRDSVKASPGTSTVTMTAEKAGNMTVTCRGRFV